MAASNPYPVYHFPIPLMGQIFSSFLKGTVRSIKKDSQRAIKGITPPIHIIGTEHIPSSGPALITINHYARHGFSIVWGAMAVAAQLPENQIWLMTSAWTDRKPGLDAMRTSATTRVFSRMAQMYGAVTTPPLPPVPEEQKERVLGIKRLLHKINKDLSAVVCIAPEGRDFAQGELGSPATGTGKLILKLESELGCIIPVGICECIGRLIIVFGEAYNLKGKGFTSSDDEAVSAYVMQNIAYLLPTSARMNYSMEEINEKK